MRIVKKIKSLIIGIGTFLLTIPTKVFASYYITVQPEYGMPKTEQNNNLFNNIWNICKIFIIPIALLIGIIIYFKKSKSSKKKKF